MGASQNTAKVAKSRAIKDSSVLAHEHYENFPVASIALPRHLRGPIALIYTFARQADDFADEGNHKPEKRLAMLQGYRNQLDLIAEKKHIRSPFFKELASIIAVSYTHLQHFLWILSR